MTEESSAYEAGEELQLKTDELIEKTEIYKYKCNAESN